MVRCRDDLVEYIIAHRATCPNPNCTEVANILAWVAHCMGATRLDVQAFEQLLVRYELNCSCEFCTPRSPERIDLL